MHIILHLLHIYFIIIKMRSLSKLSMDIHFVNYQSGRICQSSEVIRDFLVTFITLLLKQFVDYEFFFTNDMFFL